MKQLQKATAKRCDRQRTGTASKPGALVSHWRLLPTAPHTMLTINKLISQGHGLAPALLKRAAAVVLDWDTRQKSRFDTEDSQGRMLGVFLPRGTAVRGGDVLVAEDGSLVKVIATPQPVLVVRTCPEHGSPLDLLRAACILLDVPMPHLPVEFRIEKDAI